MFEAAPLAHRLAAFVGEAVTELGIRDEPGTIIPDVLDLIGEAVAHFEAHAVWPSLLTDSGVPVELSLRLGGVGEPAVRCVADVTDHRAPFADNWARYLEHARGVVGRENATEAKLWDLCRLHLDGVPPSLRSRIIHGLGYARADWRRGSLYFRTGWLRREQLAARLPEEATVLAEVERLHQSPVGGEVEVMGYDFVPRRPVRAKAYSWTRGLGGAAFDELVGRHPDLEPARTVFDTFRAGVHPSHPRALLLQTSIENGRVQQRLFFLGHAWGWDAPDRRDAVLSLLDERLGVDVAPLAEIEETATRHAVPLKLAMVAVGAEQGTPSVTFYLWPTAGSAVPADRRRTARDSRLRAAETLLARGVEYVLEARDADGSWRDYAVDLTGHADEARLPRALDAFVTAYVASTLAADPAHRHGLTETFRWLAGRYRPGLGWGWTDGANADPETTALAVVALTRSGGPVPADVVLPLEQASSDAPPEVTAAALSALMEAFPDKIGSVAPVAASLLARQRADGAWSSVGWDDDLVATWRSVRALSAYTRTDFAQAPFGEESRSAAARAVGRAGDFLSTITAPREPFRLGLFLGTWASTRGSLPEPRVARAVAVLGDLQQSDGRWLGRPHRRVGVADSASYTDARCIVTTTTAIDALQEIVARLAS